MADSAYVFAEVIPSVMRAYSQNIASGVTRRRPDLVVQAMNFIRVSSTTRSRGIDLDQIQRRTMILSG